MALSSCSRASFKLSGGGGLFSTLSDYLSFTRMILNQGSLGDANILKPDTLALMRTNQCAEGVGVNFPMWDMPDTTFGLGFALKNRPADGEPESAAGEYHWGGMAGTHFWWSPNANITGICMTQRMPAFWHPFSQDFKRLAYKIAG
ncbi:serine hydrolase [Pseudomonadales bacterium]|nr:serine hydrolase [Pseudomonadales bacterium]